MLSGERPRRDGSRRVPIKALAVFIVLVLACAAASAQSFPRLTSEQLARRLFSSPARLTDQFKRLFPGAVAFSPKEGNPPHVKAFAQDPRAHADAKPIGYVFWTLDLVPDE